MELDQLRRAFDERAANAPLFTVDPDDLIWRGNRSKRRRVTVTAASAVAVIVIGVITGVALATGSSTLGTATIIPVTRSPSSSPSQAPPGYCEPPSIAQCEATHPLPPKADRPGYGKQLLGLPIRIPITHTGHYAYSVPVSGIRTGFNSFVAGTKIVPQTAMLGQLHIFPHDSVGDPISIDISFDVASFTGNEALIIYSAQVENFGTTPPTAIPVTGTLRMTGGPPGATQPGVQGTITFQPLAGGLPSEATAGPDGSFRVSLTPGRYSVTGTSPYYQDGQLLCRAEGPVTIGTSTPPNINVDCDRR